MNDPIEYQGGATGLSLTAKLYDDSGLVDTQAMTESPASSKRYRVTNAELVALPLAAGEYGVRIEDGSGGFYGSGLLRRNGFNEIRDDDVVAQGSVNDASATTLSFTAAGLALTADKYAGQLLVFTSGTLKGVARKIATTSSGTTIALSKALPSAPADDTPFEIGGLA